jgi:hypothetical protein
MMAAIEACRTMALGCHVRRCEECEHKEIAYCSDRHCPTCQCSAAHAWLEARQADLLPVEYFHVVFTLPQQVAAVAFQNKAIVYDLLFELRPRRSRPSPAIPNISAPTTLHCRRAHLGPDADPEPSLKIPGIIISLIFSEQRKLVFRATPLQN